MPGGTSKVHVILIVTRRELSPRCSWSRALVGLGIRGTRRLWLEPGWGEWGVPSGSAK